LHYRRKGESSLSAIQQIRTVDRRFPLPSGTGSDAVHTGSEYCLAVTELYSTHNLKGTGFALTLGQGNRLVCEAIEILSPPLVGKDIEQLMSEFGRVTRQLADNATMRWLGPHKGVVHLALASIVNACFDLWAKVRGVPLWRLLLNLEPSALVDLLDLSYLEGVLDRSAALALLNRETTMRPQRMRMLNIGYPGYDTSVGWLGYDDATVKDLVRQARDSGFQAFKLKVGSHDASRDLRRAAMLRSVAGDDALIMFDANQQWTVPTAIRMSHALSEHDPLWIEEPTHPDDLQGHKQITDAIAPVKVAAGEHIPNRVLFKNFMSAGALHFVQADCTRLAGVSEFLVVSLLARHYGLPLVPHVGDMGQIHQHLVLFNHIALGHEALFLEYIPHLRTYFHTPANVRDGLYKTPQDIGASTDLK